MEMFSNGWGECVTEGYGLVGLKTQNQR